MWILFVAPFLYALCNLFDKYALATKVRHATSFAVFSGVANSILGASVLVFFGFPEGSTRSLTLLLCAGVLYGVVNFLYNLTMKERSASEIIGYIFVYPLPVALLAWLVLGEQLSWQGYFGGGLLVVGALLLSRVGAVVGSLRLVGYLSGIIALVAVANLIVKVSSDSPHSLAKVGLVNLVTGIVTLHALWIPAIRHAARQDASAVAWALGSCLLYLGGMYGFLSAASRFPISMVACVMTLQPLMVLVGERILSPFRRDVYGVESFGVRLMPIALIVLGAVLLLAQGR